MYVKRQMSTRSWSPSSTTLLGCMALSVYRYLQIPQVSSERATGPRARVHVVQERAARSLKRRQEDKRKDDHRIKNFLEGILSGTFMARSTYEGRGDQISAYLLVHSFFLTNFGIFSQISQQLIILDILSCSIK